MADKKLDSKKDGDYTIPEGCNNAQIDSDGIHAKPNTLEDVKNPHNDKRALREF